MLQYLFLQLLRRHGGTALFKSIENSSVCGKICDHPSQTTQKRPKFGVGSACGTNKPSSSKPSFPCEHICDLAISFSCNIQHTRSVLGVCSFFRGCTCVRLSCQSTRTVFYLCAQSPCVLGLRVPFIRYRGVYRVTV